ncbi:MAG TPA: MT-A70 family methyltransferase [Candidatus Saccharimonadales bacterium]
MKNKFSIVVADPPWSFFDKLQHSDVPRGALANYATMTISDIQALPVKDHCTKDGAVLCLWVPSSLLQEGLDTMKAWGFNHKQTYIWVKTKKEMFSSLLKELSSEWKKNAKKGSVKNFFTDFPLSDVKKFFITASNILDKQSLLAFGMGRLFRQTHEVCLIGTTNNKIYKKLQNKSQRSVCFAPNLKHSAKSEHLQDSLELMFPGTNNAKLELFARRERKGWCCLGNEVGDKLDIRDALDKL